MSSTVIKDDYIEYVRNATPRFALTQGRGLASTLA
jgi:hypothetical protein